MSCVIKEEGGGTTSNVDDIDSIPTMSDYLIITCRNTYINDHMTSDKISMSLQWIQKGHAKQFKDADSESSYEDNTDKPSQIYF